LLRLRRPTEREIAAELGRASGQPSYPEVGATRALEPPPASLAATYDVAHHEYEIGRGPSVYARCREALLAWRHFEIPWLELHGAEAPVSDGQVVATLISFAGLWFSSPCKVVYVARAGDFVEFAYGTLAGHPLQGEERFRVRVDPATQKVTYRIDAFSRPAMPIARLGAPLARRLHHRFAESSARALARAVL